MNIMTIDIGGTFSKIMVFLAGGDPIFYQIPTRAKLGIDYLKADICDEIRKNIDLYDIERIGISSAGIINPETGVVEEVGGAFKDYQGFSWKEAIKEEFNIDAVVENDVKCAALGEYSQGSYDNLYMITVGTGIGGCYISKGEIFRGHYGNAGEVGYIPREDSNNGHLASTYGLLYRANKYYPDKGFENGKEIFDAYHKNDEAAIDLVNYMAEALAELLGAIILILDPQVIIIGGAIADQDEALINPIKTILERELPKKIYTNVNLKNASLGNQAACFGAYKLALEI